MLKKFRKTEQGFTLIELLIVVAIIGILAAIAIPQFAAYRQRAFNSAALSDINNLVKSQTAFFDDWQSFGHTAATETGAVATLSGDPTVDNYISDTTHGMQIGRSNNVSLRCVIDANGTAFNAASKHLQGTRTYGVDSDVTAVYFKDTGIGVAFVDGDALAANAGTDDIDTAGGWSVL